MHGSTFRERWLIIDLEQTTDPTRDTKVYCNVARPCLSLPGPNGTRRFELMLHDGEQDADVLAADNVSALLRLYGNDDKAVLRRKVVYTFHARMADRWRADRVFLAGDAAHLTPPFAGQGMNSGVRDAHNLAWKLAAVVSGRLGDRLLDTYEVERRDHAAEMIQLAIRMGYVMMPRGRLQGFAVRTLLPRAGAVSGGAVLFRRDEVQAEAEIPSRLFAGAGNRVKIVQTIAGRQTVSAGAGNDGERL